MAPHAPASITTANHREEQMMIRVFLKPITIGIAILLYTAAAPITNTQTSKKTTATADLKLRQRMTSGGNENGVETVMYIKGPRMRSEMSGSTMGMTTIVQCDLKRTLMVNEKTRTYLVMPSDAPNASTGSVAGDGGGVNSGRLSDGQPASQLRGGVVNVTNTIIDTGERKEMFGFTARHIKTSIVKKASPEACDKDLKVETDGWYIDFQYAFECPGQTQKYQPSPVRPQLGCQDEIRTKTVGTAKLGFPLLVTTTIYEPDGRTSTMTQEVLELSREPLNAALFEAPEGYTLAKDMQELYGINATTSSAPNRQPDNNAAASSTGNISSTASNSASITSSATPKKPGVIRIGLIMPKVQMTAGDAAQAAEALRNGFANYLNGPKVEVVTLAARLPSLAMDEARQSQCDYVLYSSMTVKKGGGGGGMFARGLGNIAGSAAVYIPGGHTAGTAAARSATITGVYTAATIAGSIKARDELALEYKLEATDAARQGVANTVKAKASQDGEDIITPLIEKAAEAIVSVVAKK